MSGWPTLTVAELQREGVLLVEDGNHGEYRPLPTEFVEEGTPFIRAADLVGGSVQFDQAGRINDIALARIRKGIGRPGDVLFSHKGTVGKLARVPVNAPPFVCSPQTTFWRALDSTRLRRDYLYAYMRSRAFINQWWARKGETDMADYVSLTAQRQLRFVVPPVTVQRRIAAPIDWLDDLIENNRRRVAVLEEMARAIYREWFVYFRYPGHETAIFVGSSLGTIPEGWRADRLDHIAKVNRASRTPAKDETIEYLDISVLGDGSVGQLSAMSGADAPGRARRVVSTGDVVWSMVRPNRRAHALLIDPKPSWIASTGLAILTPTTVSSALLYETVSTREFSEYLISQEGGAAYPAVKPKDFEAAIILVPTPELDRKFDDAVGCQHKLIWRLRAQSAQLASTRDLLLPKLVTGQIDVSSLDLDALVEDSVA